MRNLLILACIGILIAVWAVTLDAGAPGRGPTYGPPAFNSPVVYPRYIQYHVEDIGGIFAVQLDINPSLFPGLSDIGLGDQNTSTGGPSVAGPGSMVGDHQGFGAHQGASDHHGAADHQGAADHHHGGPPNYPHHVVAHDEQGRALIPQATASHAAESGQAGATTAQPNLTPSPLSPRPPGATGPGRRLSGMSGPGLPGPGRRVTPRW
jgi:hypothetical protein